MVLNRRDFLKLATFMGVSAVITYYSGDIKSVFAETAQENGGKIHMIWLQMAGDSGCTISMLQASNPDLIEAAQNLAISADFWPTLMTPDYDLGWVSAGYTEEDQSQIPLMNAAFGDAPVDLLMVEGTPQIGTPPGGSAGDYCKVGTYNGSEVNAYELLQKLAAKATYIVAIGQCSAFGGVPAGKGNVTGAIPVTEALQKMGVTPKNPVVNMPGCPAQPDWVLVVLSSLLQGFSADLDELGRPKAFFSGYIHDNCPRRGAYDRGEMAKVFDDPTGCYWDLGCKGPITQSACAETNWNGGLSMCTKGGPMCWGCMHPSFPDTPTSSFFKPVELTSSFLGLSVDNVGEIVAIGTAGVLGIHALKHVATHGGEEKTVESEDKSLLTSEAPRDQQETTGESSA